MAVMEEFESTEELTTISLEEPVKFLVDRGRNSFDDPVAVACTLQKAARSPTDFLTPWLIRSI